MAAHKSQGQNVKAVTVISGSEFAPGQLYVACSRVFTKSGLCLRGFDLCSLIKLPKVVTDFYNSIKRENSKCLQDDFSCCRKMCIEAIEELEELPLDDEFDISLLESNFEQNVEVLVPNDEIDPENVLDDEPEPDQDLPPDNQLDFDEILSAFEPNQTVDFPENFNVSLLLDRVPCQAKRCKLRKFSDRMGYTYVYSKHLEMQTRLK